MANIITFSQHDAGSKPVDVQDVILITKVIVDHVTGTPIKACTENLAIGVESMASILMTYGSQIWRNVTVLLVVSGFWKSMTLLENILQDVGLLLGVDFSTTTIVVADSN